MYGDKGEVPEGEYIIPIGVADIKRKGTDITLVTFGKIIKVAQEAADALAKENISVEIIDLRTIRPLDKAAILASLAKTNRLVVAEEGWPVCSIGSEVLAICMEEGFDDLDAPVMRITNEDVPMPYAANLEKMALINADKIVAGVWKTVGR